MPFTQTTFLGASISNFRCNIGWGDQPSNLYVTLVEDDKNGDSFSAPSTGTRVDFSYDGWTFSGILQSWNQVAGTGGNPIFEVVVQDPREILNGSSVILAQYSGTTFSTPNLLNVYGYLESFGFGNSGRTDVGIPYLNVKNTIETLTTGGAGTYGGPLQLNGSNYAVDLTNLPTVTNLRINSEVMTIMDFIREVCDTAVHDFFFECNAGSNIIILKVRNRNVAQGTGKIADFIATTTGAASKRVGYEFSNATTGKFLVGDYMEDIYFRLADGGGDQDFGTSPEDNTIWPYWGKDLQNNSIIGTDIYSSGDWFSSDIEAASNIHNPAEVFDLEYVNAQQAMTIPSIGVDVLGIGDTYPTDVYELRAALHSQDAWENWLVYNMANEYYLDPNGSASGKFIDPATSGSLSVVDPISRQSRDVFYYHNNLVNPHFSKAYELQIKGSSSYHTAINIWAQQATGQTNKAFYRNLAMRVFDPLRTGANSGSIARTPDAYNITHERKLQKLYGYVKDFADEYYGLAYQVRIPVSSLINPDNEYGYQNEADPVSAGYFDENYWEVAEESGVFPPTNINKFLDSNNKIVAYAKFEDYFIFDSGEQERTLDLTEISESDYIVDTSGNAVYVKCSVDNEAVFRTWGDRFDARAIVRLPGRVKLNKDHYDAQKGLRRAAGVSKTAWEGIKSAIGQDPMMNSAGLDAACVMPRMIAVPLRSNINVYGPWYAVGVEGKTEMEIDTGLAPWNFGGFAGMNTVAQAKVLSAYSDYQEIEAGSVEYNGTPQILLGDELISSGPTVTDIDIQIDQGNVTTTYRMQGWEPHPYKIPNGFFDIVAKAGKQAAQDRRTLRTVAETRSSRGIQENLRKQAKVQPKRNAGGSTHMFWVGQTTTVGTVGSPTVGTQPSYNVFNIDEDDWEDRAIVSMDTLFTPAAVYQTAANFGRFPHFELKGKETQGLFDVDAINPFVSGHQFNHLSYGETVPESTQDLEYEGTGTYRFLANTYPIILAGPAYDGYGNIMSDRDDYRREMALHKCGPLDVRWNSTSRTWQSFLDVKEGYLSQELTGAGSGDIKVFEETESGWHWNGIHQDFLNRDDQLTANSGTYCHIVQFPDESYRPIYVSC